MKLVQESLNAIGIKESIQENLKKEFERACQKKEFRSFLSKLRMDDSVLMKYTSNLEKSFEQYQHCCQCNCLLECKNEINGYCYLPKVYKQFLEFHYKACKYKRTLDQDLEYQKHLSYFDVPKELKEASFQTLYKEYKTRLKVIKWLQEFILDYTNNPHQKGLYLYGNFGCGKSYLIAATLNELARKKVRCAMVFWPEFLRDLKASFSSDFKEKFDHVKKVSLLLIDDIGAENTTAWSRDEILGPLLQYRMQEQLPTFFTSNLDLESLELNLSMTKDKVDVIKARRIIERMKQMTVSMEMLSDNLRK